MPKELCADAGYGSEENYEYIDNQEIETYVKYNYFHKEQKKKWKEDPFKSDNLHYNTEEDVVICPMGQKMSKIKVSTSKTTSGYSQEHSHYQAINCEGCPMRSKCFKGKNNRVVQKNHKLLAYKEKARRNLLIDKGLYHRSNRPIEPESVFGNIKQNKGFKRFMLTRQMKVEIETYLLSIAHNLSKKATLSAA